MSQAMGKAGNPGRADIPVKALMSRNLRDQLAKFVLEVEPKERHRAIEGNDQRDERNDVGEQKTRPPERAYEGRQQQDERQLQRHRHEANRSTPRSLDNDNRPPVGDSIGENRAGRRGWKVMERAEYGPHAIEP